MGLPDIMGTRTTFHKLNFGDELPVRFLTYDNYYKCTN